MLLVKIISTSYHSSYLKSRGSGNMAQNPNRPARSVSGIYSILIGADVLICLCYNILKLVIIKEVFYEKNSPFYQGLLG